MTRFRKTKPLHALLQTCPPDGVDYYSSEDETYVSDGSQSSSSLDLSEPLCDLAGIKPSFKKKLKSATQADHAESTLQESEDQMSSDAACYEDFTPGLGLSFSEDERYVSDGSQSSSSLDMSEPLCDLAGIKPSFKKKLKAATLADHTESTLQKSEDQVSSDAACSEDFMPGLGLSFSEDEIYFSDGSQSSPSLDLSESLCDLAGIKPFFKKKLKATTQADHSESTLQESEDQMSSDAACFEDFTLLLDEHQPLSHNTSRANDEQHFPHNSHDKVGDIAGRFTDPRENDLQLFDDEYCPMPHNLHKNSDLDSEYQRLILHGTRGSHVEHHSLSNQTDEVGDGSGCPKDARGSFEFLEDKYCSIPQQRQGLSKERISQFPMTIDASTKARQNASERNEQPHDAHFIRPTPSQSIESVITPSSAHNETLLPKKRHRGSAKLSSFRPRKGEVHKCFFHRGTPVGDEAKKLTNYLGVYAKNGRLFPLHKEWGEEHLLGFEMTMDDVMKDFTFLMLDGELVSNIEGVEYPIANMEEVVHWCYENMQTKVRSWRNILKGRIGDPKHPNQARQNSPDTRVSDDAWAKLLKYWKSPTKTNQCERNKASRGLLPTHTTGAKSYARCYHEMAVKKVISADHEAYLKCHQDKNGCYPNEYTKQKCEEIVKKCVHRQFEKSKNDLQFNHALGDTFGPYNGGCEREPGSIPHNLHRNSNLDNGVPMDAIGSFGFLEEASTMTRQNASQRNERPHDAHFINPTPGQLTERVTIQSLARKETFLPKRRHRGSTKLSSCRPKKGEVHKCFFCRGTPVGDEAKKLTNYLGVYAKNGRLFPLHKEWGEEHLLGFEMTMDDVMKDFTFLMLDGELVSNMEGVEYPIANMEEVVHWCYEKIQKKVRSWRNTLKGRIDDPKEPNQECQKSPDTRVSDHAWAKLLDYWNSSTKTNQCERNKATRGAPRPAHTTVVLDDTCGPHNGGYEKEYGPMPYNLHRNSNLDNEEHQLILQDTRGSHVEHHSLSNQSDEAGDGSGRPKGARESFGFLEDEYCPIPQQPQGQSKERISQFPTNIEASTMVIRNASQRNERPHDAHFLNSTPSQLTERVITHLSAHNETFLPKKRYRGSSKLSSCRPKKGEVHKCFFRRGAPVGDEAKKLTNYLGVYAKNGTLFPLHKEWGEEHLLGFETVMDDLLKDFTFLMLDEELVSNMEGVEYPIANMEEVVHWCQATMQKKVRSWRNILKRRIGDPKLPNQACQKSPDTRVSDDAWAKLLEYWNSPTKTNECERNKASRGAPRPTHTTGAKSYARCYHEMAEKKVISADYEAYLKCHQDKNGCYPNEYTKQKCEEIAKKCAQLQLEKSKNNLQFNQVLDDTFGPHHGGYERGYGCGVSRSRLKKAHLQRVKMQPYLKQQSRIGQLEAENTLLREQLRKLNQGGTNN